MITGSLSDGSWHFPIFVVFQKNLIPSSEDVSP